MKKLLLYVLITMSSLLYGQVEYPILGIDSFGTPIVIFTEPQAQKIDFMLSELSVCDLYKQKIELQNRESIIFNNSDSLCSDIINQKDSIIQDKNKIILEKDSLFKIENSKVSNLKKQIVNKDILNKKSDEQLANNGLIIDKLKRDVTKWKLATAGGWLAAVLVTVLLVR